MMLHEAGLEIVEKYKQIKSDRANWEEQWQAVAEYFDVNRATFTTQRSPGDRRTRHLYDSTGLKVSSELAATIHSIVTNPASKWFSLEYGRDFDANDEAKEWLEDCADRMFAALNESNFNIEVTLGYRDYVNFGTGDLAMEPEPYESGQFNGVRFRATFLNEVCFELDATNRVIGMYREHMLTLRQAKLKWPDIEGKLTEQLEAEAGENVLSGKGTKKEPKIKFLECVMKRKASGYDPTKSALPAKRPFEYKLVICKTGEVLKEDGRYRLGHYLFTWNRASGEVYGRGPGFEALGTMRTLNETVRMDKEAMAKRINPPYLTRYNNIIGDLNIRPAGLTVARDPAGLVPLNTGASANESLMRIEDERNQLRSIFLLDKLALPPREQVGEMTAYEVQRRIQEMNQVLGPILARLNDELLQPIIEDLFYLMMRSGGFADMPDSVREAGTAIKVSFVNPLSRAQKVEEMAAVQLWLQDLIMLANAGKPEALDWIDDEALAPGSADTRGVPQRYVKDRDKVQAEREQRAQMEQQQAQAEINAKNADAQYKMSQGANQGGRPEGS